MSYSINGTTITLTRGDSMTVQISISDAYGNLYTPQEGDSVIFAMKQSYAEANPVLLKEIPTDTLKLTINPEDTKKLPFGSYVYDVHLVKASGEVDTFITEATIKIAREVH